MPGNEHDDTHGRNWRAALAATQNSAADGFQRLRKLCVALCGSDRARGKGDRHLYQRGRTDRPGGGLYRARGSDADRRD